MKPITVCLCGSTRFMREFHDANLRLTLEGKIVLTVGAFGHSDTDLKLDDETKAELDELHKRKIDKADEILVLNVGGYIGSSTRSEIEYARTYDRVVRYLEGCEFCGHPGETHPVCLRWHEGRSRYADSWVCPYCGDDVGEDDHEIKRDDDEYQVECTGCNKFFHAYTQVNISYRIERDDGE
jgi:hypothetical protein